MSNILATFLGLVLGTFCPVQAAVNYSWRQEDARHGYTEAVDEEKEQVGETLYFVENPYRNDLKLSEKIFDAKLSKEISTRYKEEFGRAEVEILQQRTPYLNSNFTEADSFVFNQSEYQKKQRRFGNFVVKRVAEYHFENEAKTNPQLKTINDTKQKIEKIDVSITKNIKLRAKYKISSNNIVFEVKNPYLNVQSRQELGGDKEVVFSVSKDFKNRIYFVTDYYTKNKRWDLIGVKGLTPRLSSSLAYTPFMQTKIKDDLGFEREITEHKFILGMNYSF